jgi:hypothetical protein
MRVPLLYLHYFLRKKSAIQNVHIEVCGEFHGLSKYVITFLKMLFYDDDILKILCPTIFFQGDIYTRFLHKCRLSTGVPRHWNI